MKIHYNLLAVLTFLATGVLGEGGGKTVINDCGFLSSKDNEKLYLDHDLICEEDVDGIKIVHKGVKLDCKGHMIKYKGVTPSGVDGFIVDGSDATDVMIKNCVAINWPEDAFIVVQGAEAKIEKCKGIGSKRYGLRVEDKDSFAKVKGSTFKENEEDGIFVGGDAGANIKDCSLKYNDHHGLFIEGKGTSVNLDSSKFKQNGEMDIFLDERADLCIEDLKKMPLEINVL